MKLKLPPHVQAFADRHGKARYYFRKYGLDRVPLPGLPWSPEFMAAHSAALAGQKVKPDIGSGGTGPGTIDALAVAYLQSAAFVNLASSTQATYAGILASFRREHGKKRVAKLEPHHIEQMMEQKARTPAAANNLRRMLRLLMQFAVRHKFRQDDPTLGIKSYRNKTDGFYSWSEDDIAAFEAKHPVGTRARLALALLLYTAQRRGDVIRMGRQHIKDETLSIRQQKTGTLVEVPVAPKLRAVMDATPNEHLTFLITKTGKPFSVAGFGNWFREKCDEAGLPKACAAHGLRKASLRRLCEARCAGPRGIAARLCSGH